MQLSRFFLISTICYFYNRVFIKLLKKYIKWVTLESKHQTSQVYSKLFLIAVRDMKNLCAAIEKHQQVAQATIFCFSARYLNAMKVGNREF